MSVRLTSTNVIGIGAIGVAAWRRALAAGALVSGVWLIGPAAAVGDELVIFRDTRMLRVDSAVLEGGTYVLDLGNGNRADVPAEQIRAVRPIAVEPPPPNDPWRASAGPYERFIESASTQFRLDPELLVAVALVESALDPTARSTKGALGVMQIMPATARELGLEDPFDAQKNIHAGARFLREMLDLFEGDLELALAAYNAGQGAVRKYGGVPPYPETLQYLVRVNRLVDELSTSATGL